MDPAHLKKRRVKLMGEMVALYHRGDLTEAKANGIAGALSELKEIERERERRMKEAQQDALKQKSP